MAVESHDKKLDDLLRMVEDGKAQLGLGRYEDM